MDSRDFGAWEERQADIQEDSKREYRDFWGISEETKTKTKGRGAAAKARLYY